jgi:hypothetical protein
MPSGTSETTTPRSVAGTSTSRLPRPAGAHLRTSDWQLDLIISPGGEVIWKDEDDLARAVELGIQTPETADEAYAEAHRVLEEWPFPTGWEHWKPDPAWSTPKLPDDWALSDSGLP